MIVLDANLLIYAYNADLPDHRAAERWLERTVMSGEPVRIPWSTIHAFLRIVTHSGIFPNAFPTAEATEIVEEWLAHPNVRTLEPGDRYWPILRELIAKARVRGNLLMDAHLAALTIENAGTLYTTDRDFKRFDNLRVINPLA